jgi:hypothetical protein
LGLQVDQGRRPHQTELGPASEVGDVPVALAACASADNLGPTSRTESVLDEMQRPGQPDMEERPPRPSPRRDGYSPSAPQGAGARKPLSGPIVTPRCAVDIPARPAQAASGSIPRH